MRAVAIAVRRCGDSDAARVLTARWYMGAERNSRRNKAENMKMPACQELKDQGYDVGY